MIKNQQGLTAITWLIVIGFLSVQGIMGLRVIPVYLNYGTLQTLMDALPDDPDIKMLHDLEEFPPDHIQGFYDLWCEHNRGGDGPPEIRNYHGQFPWQGAAIKWFTENYNISEE